MVCRQAVCRRFKEVRPMAEHPANDVAELTEAAVAVLRRNDLGGWTKAAPNLYPHQWSWDSAFIAVGWAHVDVARAASELETLFAAQWATGQVPQIVFDPSVGAEEYFPDAARWDCANLSPDVPAGKLTTGLVQPPVHALAAWRIREIARRPGKPAQDAAAAGAFLERLYPKLLVWHRYLHERRDPEGTGLVTIYHPWESGTDNSPRWDQTLPSVEVDRAALPPYVRRDLKPGADRSQRPTDEEYDRYLWLVELLKRARYADAAIDASYPFRVKDVLTSAILVAADRALLRIAEVVGRLHADGQAISGWIDRGEAGLAGAWDAESGLCFDIDLRTGRPIRVKTVAGFAPLLARGMVASEPGPAILTALDSPDFLGHPDLRWPLPPSTSPAEPSFRPRTYWRGPTWPFLNWLLWWALDAAGEAERAARLRRASLDQLAQPDFRFAEYADPFTGEPLGSRDQSWTAAVALDWLDAGA
jgi:glucosylglycerate hydrolase